MSFECGINKEERDRSGEDDAEKEVESVVCARPNGKETG